MFLLLKNDGTAILIALILFLLPSLMKNWRWLLGYSVAVIFLFAAAIYKIDSIKDIAAIVFYLVAMNVALVTFFGVITRGITLFMKYKGQALQKQYAVTIMCAAAAIPGSYLLLKFLILI